MTRLKFIAGILVACLTTAGHAQEPDSRWHLRVMDTHHQLKVEATIRFTDEAVGSCMDGGWKRVTVEAKGVQAEEFFPLNTPIAYKLKDGKLTLGHTHVCDGYLFLTGKPEGPIVQGTYDAVGWGRKELGTFSLQKI